MNDPQFLRQAKSLLELMKKATKTGIILNSVDVKFVLSCIQEAMEYRKLKEKSKI